MIRDARFFTTVSQDARPKEKVDVHSRLRDAIMIANAKFRVRFAAKRHIRFRVNDFVVKGQIRSTA